MKKTSATKISNDLRKVAIEADRRNVNSFRENFSLIMDFRLLMDHLDIRFNHPYRTMEQRIMFVTGGSVKVDTNSIVHDLKKNSVLVMPEDTIIELLSASDDFNAHELAFKVRSFEKCSSAQFNILRLDLSDSEGTFLEKYFQLFDGLFSMDIKVLGPLEDMCSFVMSFLYYKYNIALGSTQFISRSSKTFDEFIRQINLEAIDNREVAHYADKLGVTVRYLGALVKARSGRSAKDWINHIVVRDAKLMLDESNESIRKIAIRMGFCNATQFGTFFRKHTGMTPMEYRNGKGLPKGEAEEKINS